MKGWKKENELLFISRNRAGCLCLHHVWCASASLSPLPCVRPGSVLATTVTDQALCRHGVLVLIPHSESWAEPLLREPVFSALLLPQLEKLTLSVNGSHCSVTRVEGDGSQRFIFCIATYVRVLALIITSKFERFLLHLFFRLSQSVTLRDCAHLYREAHRLESFGVVRQGAWFWTQPRSDSRFRLE